MRTTYNTFLVKLISDQDGWLAINGEVSNKDPVDLH